jgi:uncharacterized damage-inducible protein DinB
MSAHLVFLEYSANKLEQMATRIAACLDQLTPEQIWIRGSDNENAVGNLVLHLSGNVRQWIGMGVGKLPDVRERDAEFAAKGGDATALTERLSATVAEAASIIRGVSEAGLTERTRVQGYDITVLEAIYHVIEHFSGHTGQIIFATKLLTGSDLGFYKHVHKPAAHSEKVP